MKGRIITAKAIDEFKEHLILEERSKITVEKYIRDVKASAAHAENGTITKETVIAYKKHLQENYAVRSVNSMLASINSLFAFLGWHDLRVKSLKLQQQVFCPEEKELTKAEYTRLCRTAERKHNERLNLILQTICGTGIRVSELQYITVEAVKQGEAVVNCKAKTRSVFIVKELRQKLLRYAAEQNIKSGMIFVTRTGKPISRTNIWRESQAYQALSAAYCVNRMKDMGVDGMLRCCLMGGANDGGYLKPPIDNYGYPKLAFYALRNGFAELSASLGSFDIIKERNFSVNPVIYGTNEGKRYELTIRIFDSQQHLCYEKTLTADGAQGNTRFGILTPQLNVSGYYSSELKIRIVE